MMNGVIQGQIDTCIVIVECRKTKQNAYNLISVSMHGAKTTPKPMEMIHVLSIPSI